MDLSEIRIGQPSLGSPSRPRIPPTTMPDQGGVVAEGNDGVARKVVQISGLPAKLGHLAVRLGKTTAKKIMIPQDKVDFGSGKPVGQIFQFGLGTTTQKYLQ